MSKNRQKLGGEFTFKKLKTERNKSCKFVGFLEDQQTIQVLSRPVRGQMKEKQQLKKRKAIARSCKK